MRRVQVAEWTGRVLVSVYEDIVHTCVDGLITQAASTAEVKADRREGQYVDSVSKHRYRSLLL